MIEQAKEIFQRQFENEALRLVDRAKIDVGQAMDKASAAGALRSSRMVLQVEDVLAGAEAAMLDTSFALLLRSLNAAGISISAENAQIAYDICEEAVRSESPEIRGIMFSKPMFSGEKALIPNEQSIERLDKARNLELDRVRTEFDLIAMQNAIAKNSSDKSDNAMIFNGPVNQVVAGSHNTSTANQIIDTYGAQQLSDALDTVLAALSSGSVSDSDAALIEVTSEAKKEARKEKPNRFKISGLLGALNQLVYCPESARCLRSPSRGGGWSWASVISNE